MSKNGFEIDLSKTFDDFCKLTKYETTKACMSALSAGAREIVSITKSNAVSGMKKRNNPHWYRGEPKVYSDKIEDAPRYKRGYVSYGKTSGDLYVKVQVLGSTDTESGTFRFRFLEKGTKQRFAKYYRAKDGGRKVLKKARNLGRITPRRWFKAAQQAVEPRLDAIYLQEIDKAIDKINNSSK